MDSEGDSGKKRMVAGKINIVVRQRFASEYKRLTDKVPPSLRKGKAMTATAIPRFLGELNALLTVPFSTQTADFAEFRKVCACACTPVPLATA